MITFTRTNPNDDLKVKVTISDENAWPEVLEAVESFLLACGYTLDGKLEVVPLEENDK